LNFKQLEMNFKSNSSDKSLILRQSAPWRHSLARSIGHAAAVLLFSGLLGAMLVRYAPGFHGNELALDPRFSARSIEALERGRAEERDALSFYAGFLWRMVHGDLGRSEAFGQPVAQMIRERAPRTAITVAEGLWGGWLLALLLAAASAVTRHPGPSLFGMVSSGSLLGVPSSLLATVCLLLRLPPAAAIAAVVFPRVFPHVYEQLRAAAEKPHVLMARSRGVGERRLFLCHIIPTAAMPILAVGGLSVTLAFGATIPVEVLADSPGLGQLAWRAALGRDIPVLVSLTLVPTAITVLANLLADLTISGVRRKA
jgi:peptide/nickel transport system permease protein